MPHQVASIPRNESLVSERRTAARGALRELEVRRIRRALERAHSPRLHMMLIVGLTGAAGFFTSATLMHAGVDLLWLRYALAVGCAYLAFLGLLWCWLCLRRDDLADAAGNAPDLLTSGGGAPSCRPDDVAFSGGEFGGGGAGGSFADDEMLGHAAMRSVADAPAADPGVGAKLGSGAADAAAGALDAEELAVVVLAIAALVGAAWAALWLVWGAPLLLAELVFDAALAAGLYRRLRSVRGEHWLRTAVQRTLFPFAAVTLLFALAGAVMQHVVPEARSVGQVFRALEHDR